MAEKDTSAQRLKLLYLRDIFQKFTSETEALTRNQITDILSDYGITEGRKAFSEDVEALQKYGMDIRMTMGRTASYQLMTRDFELAELKLLADAVSSAKLLSESQSAALLKKLGRTPTKLCFTTWILSSGRYRRLRRRKYPSGTLSTTCARTKNTATKRGCARPTPWCGTTTTTTSWRGTTTAGPTQTSA